MTRSKNKKLFTQLTAVYCLYSTSRTVGNDVPNLTFHISPELPTYTDFS